MMGSGTTPIAAKRLGRDAFGFDLDPLAVTLAKGLLHHGRARNLESTAAAILATARRLASRSASSGFDEEERSFVRFWFPSQAQIQLSALARAIREESTAGAQSFFWSIYSSLILVKSAGPSFAMDLARSRPHRVFDKSLVMPFEAWMPKSLKAIERKDRLWQEKPRSRCVVRQGDARKLPLHSGTVDFVLTSPPYLHGIDYIRAHKFSLVWMGRSIRQLREIRGSMIGSERGLFVKDGLPMDIEDDLWRSSKSSEARTRRYLSDLHHVLKELSRVVRMGGIAVWVTGPSVISDRHEDAEEVFSELACDVGFRLVASESRNISSRRRSLPPPAAVSKSNSLSRRLRNEAFLAFRRI